MPRRKRDSYRQELQRARGNLGTAFTHIQRLHSEFEDRVDDYRMQLRESVESPKLSRMRPFWRKEKILRQLLNGLAIFDELIENTLRDI